MAALPLLGQVASVQLAVIGGFGQPRRACHVESFRNLDEPLPDGGFREYKASFRNLKAARIPYARYEAAVNCSDGSGGHKEVQVDLPRDFDVIATSERRSRIHDKKPDLKVPLESKRAPGEMWWLRLLALYHSYEVSAEFDSSTGYATFYDPRPGRYLVSVEASNGFTCSRQIDILDAPDAWSVDAATCEFVLDGRARLVKPQKP